MSATLTKTLKRSLNDPVDEITKTLRGGGYAFVHLADPEGLMGSDSFIRTAYRDPNVRTRAVELAKIGFHVYQVADGVARFVAEEHIPNLWHLVRDGTFEVSELGTIYKLEPPSTGGPARNLIVLFSSISSDMFGNGLSRYFMQNYKSLNRHVPGDTAILRIADIGGIVGAFYLDTQNAPENSKRISELIETTRGELGLSKNSVIAYGASKGATGALYHAVKNGYRCVCVEPVVNDEYYETAYRDSHFTADGIFIRSKEEIFGDLAKSLTTGRHSASEHLQPNYVVIYSDQSPQAPYISKILDGDSMPTVALINYRHPMIKDHADVSPQSLNLVSMYMNMMCYGLPLPSGNAIYECRAPATT